LFIALASVLVLVLAGAGMAALFMLPKSAEGPAVSSAPLPPDPGSPPPLPQFTVGTTPSAASGDTEQTLQPEDMQAAIKSLLPKLLIGAGETSAPRELIVRGGSAGDAELTVPHHQRWEFTFPVGTTIESYSRQLDSFGIELGVLGGASTVSYLSNLANPKPRVRTAAAGSDTRIYLIWNSGPLREVDDVLVARAGFDPAGKVLAHFIPPETEKELLRLEAAAAQSKKLQNVRKTVFTIQTVGPDQFRLAVAAQKGD
jgi:hypothetical protein